MAAPRDTTGAGASLGAVFRVQGEYVQFDVAAATLGMRNCVLTSAPHSRDMTGGVATPVFASKLHDHRGLALTKPLALQLAGETSRRSRRVSPTPRAPTPS